VPGRTRAPALRVSLGKNLKSGLNALAKRNAGLVGDFSPRRDFLFYNLIQGSRRESTGNDRSGAYGCQHGAAAPENGHTCVVYDRSPESVKQLSAKDTGPTLSTISCRNCEAARDLLMVPAGVVGRDDS